MTDGKKDRKSPDSLTEASEDAKIALNEEQLKGVTGGTKAQEIHIESWSFGTGASNTPTLKQK